MPDRVKVSCPQCDKSYRIPINKMGKRTTCKKCGTKFVLESSAELNNLQSTRQPQEQGEWHVTIGRESEGAFSTSQVTLMIREGRVTSDTLVWKSGMEDWQPVSSIEEFNGNIPAMDIPDDLFTDDSAEAFFDDIEVVGTDRSDFLPIDDPSPQQGSKGLFGGIKDAVANASQQAQKHMVCAGCSTKMSTYEYAAKMGKCAKCALLDTGLLSDPNEEFIFSQAATYKGGLPDHIEQGKRNGFIYVYSSSLYFFDDVVRWNNPFTKIIFAELDTYQLGGTRAAFAGIGAIALKQVRNTLVVTFLDHEGIERSVRFQIHGSLTIPGEEEKANEFLHHLLRFKSPFVTTGSSVSSSGELDIEARLQKLESMKDKGLIRGDEYEKKRAELIDLL